MMVDLDIWNLAQSISFP